MRQIITALILATLVTMQVSAKGITPDNENGLKEIKTTAYCQGTTTASGQKVRYGICAGQDWMVDDGNWVALIWSEDGTEFYGYFEVLDKGGTDAIKDGYVIDVYFPTYEDCKQWMKETNGKCLVKYIQAEG